MNIQRRAKEIRASDELLPITKVICWTDETHAVEIGNDRGRAFECECPWATEEIVQGILDSLQGYQYSPYSAPTAYVDPGFELGDYIEVGNVASEIYSYTTTFSPGMTSTIGAPQDKEVEHEYNYKSPKDRQHTREIGQLRTSLSVQDGRITAIVEETIPEVDGKIGIVSADLTVERGRIDSIVTETIPGLESIISQQADQIEARVTRTGDNGGAGSESFSWSLLSNAFELKAGNSTVFKASKNGVEVNGKITATSGWIGTASSGWEIKSDYIQWGGGASGGANGGIYFGSQGLKFADSNGVQFSVTPKGVVTANNGTFSGEIHASSGYFGDANSGTQWKIRNDAIVWGGTEDLPSTTGSIYFGQGGLIFTNTDGLRTFYVEPTSGNVTIGNATADSAGSSHVYINGTLTVGGQNNKITAGGLYSGAGGGNFYNNSTTLGTSIYPNVFYSKNMYATELSSDVVGTSQLWIGYSPNRRQCSLQHITDPDTGKHFYVLGYETLY